jgi:flagellar assembly factor FliW
VGGYRAVLSDEDKARLLADDTAELVWLAIVTAGDAGAPTVNLRAPLVINPASLRGIQLMPAESDYSFEHPLQAA